MNAPLSLISTAPDSELNTSAFIAGKIPVPSEPKGCKVPILVAAVAPGNLLLISIDDALPTSIPNALANRSAPIGKSCKSATAKASGDTFALKTLAKFQ